MIIDLTDIRAADINLTGGKASKLAFLIANNFPVPSGFVITTKAFNKFIEENGIESDIDHLFMAANDFHALELKATKLQNLIVSRDFPKDMYLEIAEHLSRFDSETIWAVRSSAVAEDLEKASFAGQYSTFLGICGLDEVLNAILRCWASFFNVHSIIYRSANNIRDIRGAVIVQQLIDSDAAGVCFSADPISGDKNRIVLNANYGLGESVVSGRVTPDTFVIDKVKLNISDMIIGSKNVIVTLTIGGSEEQPVEDSKRQVACLTNEEVIGIAKLAKKIEECEKRHVDIEWAFSKGKLYLLQSRPITSINAGYESFTDLPPKGWKPQLDTPIDTRYPIYSRGNISEVLPGCITPLSWSYIGPTIEQAFCSLGIAIGAIEPGGAEYRILGFFFHRPYICVSFMKDMAARTPGMSPDVIHEEFVGPLDKKTPPLTIRDLLPDKWHKLAKVASIFHKKYKSIDADTNRSDDFIRQWQKQTTSDKLKFFSDVDLIKEVRFSEKLALVSNVHIWASSFAAVFFDLLRKLTNAYLGDRDGSLASRLLTGIGSLPSADPAFGIYELAQIVISNGSLEDRFTSIKDNTKLFHYLQQNNTSDEFIIKLNEFLSMFGHRAVCEAEFRNPCWREDPAQVLGLVRNYLSKNSISPADVRERQHRVASEAFEGIETLRWPKKQILMYVLGATRNHVGLREHLKDLIVLRSDIARRVYTEIAERLISGGLISEIDDIYFLIGEEVWKLLMGNLSKETAKEIISNRRKDFCWSESVDVPKIQDGKPIFITPHEYSPERTLKGIGVSPGKVEGLARVICDPRIDSHMEPGEILVAPVTDAGWTPLFINAAGLVVDVGGLLSHGSVVAREYGLPAVVGVDNATKQIKTGDRIFVDGSSGIVIRMDT